jgi:hypothetical protein
LIVEKERHMDDTRKIVGAVVLCVNRSGKISGRGREEEKEERLKNC